MIKLLCTSILAMQTILNSNFTETEYEKVERVFANNASHIDNHVHFIGDVLLKGQQKEAFLDIGPGPATITDRLSKFFKSTSVVEPNRAFAPLYTSKGFIYYHDNFQKVNIDRNYDLILCSHVLYHVPQEEWRLFLKKMVQMIGLDGKAVITMNTPTGKFHGLCDSINPDYRHSRKVESVLQDLQISYDLIPIQSCFTVQNYDDFRALIRLFALEDCFYPHEYLALSDCDKACIEQKIEEYVAACLQPDNSYEFYAEEAHIVIHK